MTDKVFEFCDAILNFFHFRPNVKKEKKGGYNSGKEIKPKVTSRINTNMVKLKLLDATRKAIIDKTKKTFVSSYAQTDTFKTKLCKDQSIENQSDLLSVADATTETDVELVAYRAKDGTRELDLKSDFYFFNLLLF